jgi:hypothetical protein
MKRNPVKTKMIIGGALLAGIYFLTRNCDFKVDNPRICNPEEDGPIYNAYILSAEYSQENGQCSGQTVRYGSGLHEDFVTTTASEDVCTRLINDIVEVDTSPRGNNHITKVLRRRD